MLDIIGFEAPSSMLDLSSEAPLVRALHQGMEVRAMAVNIVPGLRDVGSCYIMKDNGKHFVIIVLQT